MYTKLFSHITESTVWHEDDPTRLVWITLLAMCDREGFVHSSLLGVSSRARVSLECTESAIGKFLSPDPLSMSKEYEGRRIEPVEGGWRLLNYIKYRDIKTADERREYMRNWMREKRKASKQVEEVSKPLANVENVDRVSPSDSYSLSAKKQESKAMRTKVRPTLEEVKAYCKERQNNVNPEKWLAHYTANGFRVNGGKAPMKDWKSAVITWEKDKNGGSNERKTAAQLRNERAETLLDNYWPEEGAG